MLVGLVVAGTFGWLLLREIDLPGLGRAAAALEYGWMPVAVTALLAGYALRIERWRLMLATSNGALRWRHCAGPLMAGFAVNNLLPLRAGDLLRAFSFTKRLGVPAGSVLATLLAERVLDLAALLLLLSVAYWLLRPPAPLAVGLTLGLSCAGAVVILLIAFSPRISLALAQAARRTSGRLSQNLDRGLQTLRAIAGPLSLPRLLMLSLAAWLAEGAAFLCTAQAVLTLSAPAAAGLALPMGTLATLLPGTPGHIGSFDYFVARAMSLLGNPAESAAAYALIVHAVVWLPPTLAGGSWLLATHIGTPNAEPHCPTRTDTM